MSAQERLESLKQQYQRIGMTEGQVDEMKQRIEEAKMENGRQRGHIAGKVAAAAAAVIVVFVALPNISADAADIMSNLPVIGPLVEVVTFRDYQYDSERNSADVEVPGLLPVENETGEPEVQEKLEKSTEEINAEIKEITDKLITEFEANLKEEAGYQDISIKSEVINTDENYFTLKLICYQASGSGAEWDYFYTIDINTGERVALADIFKEETDYITPISENIKEQMRKQMAEDESKVYWLDTDETPEWDFQAITDETSFYLNTDGNIVICFNEGDVAPMYMGVVEFEIPSEVVADIRK